MIVIKLGGSLAHSRLLPDCLDSIGQHYHDESVVVVPGGGGFADQVRLSQQVWQFDDKTAHAMAILAMQQMALLFRGLDNRFVLAHSADAIADLLTTTNKVVWSPDLAELDRAGIVASWDVTSDSLAAWLAMSLSADALVLVKSATIDPLWPLPVLTRQQIIDPAFCGFVACASFPISIMDAQQFKAAPVHQKMTGKKTLPALPG